MYSVLKQILLLSVAARSQSRFPEPHLLRCFYGAILGRSKSGLNLARACVHGTLDSWALHIRTHRKTLVVSFQLNLLTKKRHQSGQTKSPEKLKKKKKKDPTSSLCALMGWRNSRGANLNHSDWWRRNYKKHVSDLRLAEVG